MTNDFNEYSYLCHHGVLGMKWGVRRYQNPDGTLTAAGRKRYGGKQAQRWKNNENKRYDKKTAKAEKKGKTEEVSRYKAEKAGLNKMTEDQLGDELLRIKRNTDKGTILGGALAGAGSGLATIDSIRRSRSLRVSDISSEKDSNNVTGFSPDPSWGENNYSKKISKDKLKGTSANKDVEITYNDGGTPEGKAKAKEVVPHIEKNIADIDKACHEAVIEELSGKDWKDLYKSWGIGLNDSLKKERTNLFAVRYLADSPLNDQVELVYRFDDWGIFDVEYDLKNNKALRVGFND